MQYSLSVLVAALGLWAPTASAGLILISPEVFQGTGVGNVPTLLRISDNQSTVSGCQGYSGAGTQFDGQGDCAGSASSVQTSQSTVRSLAEGGIDFPSDFRIIFNAIQSAGGPISLLSLVASFYTPDGTLLYQTAGLTCPGLTGCTFPSTLTGQGNSGFAFGLDTTQLQEAINAGVFANPLNLVGVAASVDGNTGGPESFFLASAGLGLPNDIVDTPEPATFAIIGLGTIALGLIRRHRN